MSSNPELSTEDLAGTAAPPRDGYDATVDSPPEEAVTPGATADSDQPWSTGTEVRTDQGGPEPPRGTRGAGADVVADDPARSRADWGAGAAAPAGTADMGGAAGGQPDGGATEVTLLDPADQTSFRQRWSDAQTRFVDDPQEAVRTADGLVAELMQSLARGFSEHKARLEAQWQSGDDPDTEELRQALQRYRSFFTRLLST